MSDAVLHGGYYDIYRLAELRAELDAINPQRDVILNAANIDHLDCACLGALVATLRVWRERDPATNLRLSNVHGLMARVLALTMLDRVFIIDSREA